MTDGNGKQFLGYLHSFRGFAIINIVLIHATVAALVGSGGMDFSDPVTITNEVLFHDSTLYFALISGLLFTAILRIKGYRRFYVNKLKYVLLPYIIFTLIGTAGTVFGFKQAGEPTFTNYLSQIPFNLWYGKGFFPLWYIPILFFLYAVTPLFDYLLRQGKVGMIISVIITLVPFVVSREPLSFEGTIGLPTVIYFLGAYVLGMILGNDLDKTIERVNQYRIPLIIISIISTSALFYLYFIDFKTPGITSLRESLFYLQKLAVAGLVIVAYHKLGPSQPKWLHTVAKDSFGIYFLHGFFVFGGIPIFSFVLSASNIAPFNKVFGGILLFFFSMAVCLLLLFLFRKLLGKNSRMIFGS